MKNLIFLLFIIATISLQANALSIASDYLANNTLELIEGTSKIYGIRLQNPSEYEVGIKLDYDPTFMKVIDYKEVYYIPPKTTGYSISFNISAPKKPGLYQVSYTVGEVEPSASGGLPIRLKISRGFSLKVIENPNNLNVTKNPNRFHIKYSYFAYAAIVLLILLYIIMKKHAKKLMKNKTRKF